MGANGYGGRTGGCRGSGGDARHSPPPPSRTTVAFRRVIGSRGAVSRSDRRRPRGSGRRPSTPAATSGAATRLWAASTAICRRGGGSCGSGPVVALALRSRRGRPASWAAAAYLPLTGWSISVDPRRGYGAASRFGWSTRCGISRGIRAFGATLGGDSPPAFSVLFSRGAGVRSRLARRSGDGSSARAASRGGIFRTVFATSTRATIGGSAARGPARTGRGRRIGRGIAGGGSATTFSPTPGSGTGVGGTGRPTTDGRGGHPSALFCVPSKVVGPVLGGPATGASSTAG